MSATLNTVNYPLELVTYCMRYLVPMAASETIGVCFASIPRSRLSSFCIEPNIVEFYEVGRAVDGRVMELLSSVTRAPLVALPDDRELGIMISNKLQSYEPFDFAGLFNVTPRPTFWANQVQAQVVFVSFYFIEHYLQLAHTLYGTSHRIRTPKSMLDSETAECFETAVQELGLRADPIFIANHEHISKLRDTWTWLMFARYVLLEKTLRPREEIPFNFAAVDSRTIVPPKKRNIFLDKHSKRDPRSRKRARRNLARNVVQVVARMFQDAGI
jgi:hypothetical protein